MFINANNKMQHFALQSEGQKYPVIRTKGLSQMHAKNREKPYFPVPMCI